jgi:flagellar assembly protein FliH
MTKLFRPYRFPPLSQFIAAGQRMDDTDGQWRASVAQGFEQGQRDGYDLGFERGQLDGYEAGREAGVQQGRAEGKQQTLGNFEQLARPLDAILTSLKALRSDYRAAQRKEVVELVAKVARQVIRAELALQPVQLLSLVDETLAAMPPTREDIDVFLNPEELTRILELDPKRAKRWNLIADARLDFGECRIRAGDNEVDAGCHQRLAACMEQVTNHLALAAEQSERDEMDAPLREAAPLQQGAPVGAAADARETAMQHAHPNGDAPPC